VSGNVDISRTHNHRIPISTVVQAVDVIGLSPRIPLAIDPAIIAIHPHRTRTHVAGFIHIVAGHNFWLPSLFGPQKAVSLVDAPIALPNQAIGSNTRRLPKHGIKPFGNRNFYPLRIIKFSVLIVIRLYPEHSGLINLPPKAFNNVPRRHLVGFHPDIIQSGRIT
jgi:hypothetical protein